MDSGDEPLPMIKRDPLSVPMGGPFSAPFDNFNLRSGLILDADHGLLFGAD
jgi:hypothetical protein